MRPNPSWFTKWLDSRTSFAILDQMVVSAGNFVTNLVMIRTLAPDIFGIYAVLWSLMLLLNTLQSSLVVHPMLVTASGESSRGRVLASAGLCATAALALPFAGAVVIATAVVHRLELAIWIVPALLAWQLQETLRRALMAQRRYGDCIWGDAVSYPGQAIGLYALAAAGLLSLPSVFVCMTATSVLAAAIQVMQVRPAWFSLGELKTALAEFWKIGHWILNTNVIASVITTAVPWYLALMRGAVGAAEYQALYYVTGVVQPLMMSIGSLVTVEVARSSTNGTFPGSLRAISRPVLLGAGAISAYGLVLAIFPSRVLALLFRSGSLYAGLGAQLRVFMLAALLLYLSQMLIEVLVGLRATREAFFAQLCGSIACAATGILLIPFAGVLGAAIALAAAYLARTICGAVYARNAVVQGARWRATASVVVAGEAI